MPRRSASLRTISKTQLEFIDKELHTRETGTLAKLQGAKTPEQAAAAFIDYERPSGWTPQNPAGGMGYQSRINLARSVYNGRPGDMSMGPAGSAWVQAHNQIVLDDASTRQWKTVMDDYKKEGTRPALSVVNDVSNAAYATSNGALLDQIKHDTVLMNLTDEGAQQSLPAQHARNAADIATGARGDLPPAMAALQKDLQHRTDAITKGLADNPIATAAANLPNQIKPQPPVDEVPVTEIRRDAFRELEHLTGDLPPTERAAVVLRYGYDLPYAQIADALGSTEQGRASRGVDRRAPTEEDT